MAGQLTSKKRKFAQALVLGCAKPGDLSTSHIEAASLLAGYKNANQGYKMVTQSGQVKDPTVAKYIKKLLSEETDDEQPEWDLEDPTIPLEKLQQVLDDDESPAGAVVRASELLLKYHGIEKPKEGERETDPKETLEHMMMLLNVEGDVDPFTLGLRSQKDSMQP